MKRFLLTALFVLIASLAFAQERIAVFPFEDRNNVYTKDELDSFYAEFSNEFANKTDDRRFTVLARDDLEKLINMEAKFQLSDYSSKEKTAEMQRVLNAQQILYCLILKVGNEIRITVSRRSFPELSVLRGGKTINVTNKNQLFGKIPELVQAMVTEIAGGVTPAQTNPTGNSTPTQTNPTGNSTQQYDPESDFKAELMEGGKSVRIIGYRGEKWTVRIPPQIQGIPVTHIGDEAFSHTNITNVIIPDGVISIGDFVFYQCTGLTSITIPNSITSIGKEAFYNCTSLTSVSIPNSVTTIRDFAFSGCTSLANVIIGNSVTIIGIHAFNNCTSLVSVTIPNSITVIGEGAFAHSTSLTAINVTADNKAYTVVDGIMYNKDKSLLHTYPAGKKGNFIIPHGVITIGEYAFGSCVGLTSVTIPNSVTSIGDGTFSNCTSLSRVIIPNSVISVGKLAFSNCSSLISVTIPNSVTSIGEYAFTLCTSLASVTLPNSITRIENRTFRDSGLTSITIPDSVTSIGISAFDGCTRLASVTIPDSVHSIVSYAFSKCSSLARITIPKSVNGIGDFAFSDCTSLTSVTFQGTPFHIGTGKAVFDGDLRDVFYTVNNGTPGTYITSKPGKDAKWRKL